MRGHPRHHWRTTRKEPGTPPVPVDFAPGSWSAWASARALRDLRPAGHAAGPLFVAFMAETVSGIGAGRRRADGRAVPGTAPCPDRPVRDCRPKPFPGWWAPCAPAGPGLPWIWTLDPSVAAVLRGRTGGPDGELRAALLDLPRPGCPVPARIAAVAGTLAAPVSRCSCRATGHARRTGSSCDAGYLPATGDALRDAEGIDRAEVDAVVAQRLGVPRQRAPPYLLPPHCAHARRITPPAGCPSPPRGTPGRRATEPAKSCRPLPSLNRYAPEESHAQYRQRRRDRRRRPHRASARTTHATAIGELRLAAADHALVYCGFQEPDVVDLRIARAGLGRTRDGDTRRAVRAARGRPRTESTKTSRASGARSRCPST